MIGNIKTHAYTVGETLVETKTEAMYERGKAANQKLTSERWRS